MKGEFHSSLKIAANQIGRTMQSNDKWTFNSFHRKVAKTVSVVTTLLTAKILKTKKPQSESHVMSAGNGPFCSEPDRWQLHNNSGPYNDEVIHGLLIVHLDRAQVPTKIQCSWDSWSFFIFLLMLHCWVTILISFVILPWLISGCCQSRNIHNIMKILVRFQLNGV